MRRTTARAVGLVTGYAADRAFGDPRRGHPVAGFGTVAARLETVSYRDSRAAGAGHVLVLTGGAVAAGVLAERVVAGRWLPTVLVTAFATWTVLGGTTLGRTGGALADRLEAGDLAGARELLPSLCGRDPSVLDADGSARAALESVAENTSDATVAPLFWGAVAGVPGLLGYRAVNTLDAMIGYRNPRYRRFGWAAARIDDVANLVPARIAGLLTVLCAPLAGPGGPGTSGGRAAAVRAWRADAAQHPSPNAGVAEATMAGALGVQLGGRTEYRHGVEMRPPLGSGPTPRVPDLRRAVRLSTAVQTAAAVTAAAIALVGTRRAPGRSPG
ncbi:cobalamin biosynthesis protein [Nocardia stercoris]|uniref:Cobalamin biosynthesis protein CobD n=1 Tax=Nocardia stercoris TaxID=2483361 RepID=A0A3M2L0U8_9NOCA|nr:cobalamin biosynthesis protein [Nocardia stercoris]RMI29425.1 cobalamin biosynthesis protein [Nocardia stercoris]